MGWLDNTIKGNIDTAVSGLGDQGKFLSNLGEGKISLGTSAGGMAKILASPLYQDPGMKHILESIASSVDNPKQIPEDIYATAKKAGKDISNVAKTAGGQIAGGWQDFRDWFEGLAAKSGLGEFKPDDITIGGPGGGGSGGGTGSAGLDADKAQLQKFLDAIGTTGRGTPQADLGDTNYLRSREISILNQLQDAANGQGPSVAETSLKAARDANIATAVALAASQRGLTPGQGLRLIADQTAAANQNAANEAARQRVAEQLAAREQLIGATTAVRSQDQDLALAQVANDLKARGLDDEQVRALMAQMSGIDIAAMQNAFSYDKLRADTALGQQKIKADAYASHQKAVGDFLSKLGQGFAGAPSAIMGSTGPNGASTPGWSSMFGGGGGAAAAPAVPLGLTDPNNFYFDPNGEGYGIKFA